MSALDSVLANALAHGNDLARWRDDIEASRVRQELDAATLEASRNQLLSVIEELDAIKAALDGVPGAQQQAQDLAEQVEAIRKVVGP